MAFRASMASGSNCRPDMAPGPDVNSSKSDIRCFENSREKRHCRICRMLRVALRFSPDDGIVVHCPGSRTIRRAADVPWCLLGGSGGAATKNVKGIEPMGATSMTHEELL